jgi:hypothetical protein
MRIAISILMGAGCVSAACPARRGHGVVRVDVNPHEVDMVDGGHALSVEPGLAELITTPPYDVSTMNRLVAYMALSRLIVSDDLTAARVSVGEAALYAMPSDVADFARCIARLPGSPAERDGMGKAGCRRFEQELSWQRPEDQPVAAAERAIQRRGRQE